jgi:integrase
MPGRPRLPLGAYGKIRTRALGDKQWQAITQYRDADGRTRQYGRRGPSEAAAVRKLKRELTDKSRPTPQHRAITAGTRLSVLAEEYFDRLRARVEAGDKSPNTLRLYRGHYDNHVAPALGGLAISEADVQRLDWFLMELRRRHSANLVKTVRAVLSGMLGLATRYGVIAANPVRDVGDIPGSGLKRVRALEPAEAADLWRRLTVLAQTTPEKAANDRRHRQAEIDPDLPDLVLWMLGTSDRIGNALAVHWPWLDLEDATAQLGPNVIRVKGEGLRLNEGTSKTRDAVLDLPEPVVAMLLARQQRESYSPMGPVFCDSFGGLRDPNNTSKALRAALDSAGYDWVTSHVFRKTVATVLDDAGLSARHVADQLRHARPSMTQDRYMKRGARNPRAKAAIEAMLSTSPERKVVGLTRPEDG